MKYREMETLYGTLIACMPGAFELQDTGSSYVLVHKKLHLAVELPLALEERATTRVNMMAPFRGVGSPEAILQGLYSFLRKRDFLRERGYEQGEHFEEYNDGVECVYNIPTVSVSGLARIIRDFGECRD